MRDIKILAVFAVMVLSAMSAKSNNVSDTVQGADTTKVVKPSCWKPGLCTTTAVPCWSIFVKF